MYREDEGAERGEAVEGGHDENDCVEPGVLMILDWKKGLLKLCKCM